MFRVLVSISIPAESIEIIRSTPDLPQKELEFIKQWQQEGLLENFYVSQSKLGAVLIFKEVSETMTKELVESLPYFPYMSKVEYLTLNKHF